jgi:hypothetical protein
MPICNIDEQAFSFGEWKMLPGYNMLIIQKKKKYFPDQCIQLNRKKPFLFSYFTQVEYGVILPVSGTHFMHKKSHPAFRGMAA